MTDLTKLKELAEKLAPAYRDPWESHRHSASAVTVGAVNESGEYNDFLDVRISDYSAFDEHDDELAEWIAAANPQAILGLIAEVERLRGQVGPLARGAEQAMEERDRLKAENDALRKQLEQVHPFKFAGPIEGPDLKCAACGGYHYGLPAGMPCPKSAAVAYDAALEGGGK